MATGPWEQYQEQVRRRNEINRQKAMQGAGAGAAAAEKARREREWLQEQLAEMRRNQAQGKNQAATVQEHAATIDEIPGQFSNVIQSVQPPPPALHPRMGGGLQESRTGAVPGLTGSGTIGDIDWSVTPWFIDQQTNQMRVLPANNKKTGFLGTGEFGEETGMTDDQFKLAWAHQLALGKEPPSWASTTFGRGSDAPSKAEALKLLRENNQFTGALETPEVREGRERRAREQADKESISKQLKELYPVAEEETTGPNLGRRFVDFLTGADDAQNQRIRGDAVAQDVVSSMEMDDPTRSRPITPMVALTPAEQFEQQLQAEAAATAAAPAAPAALTAAEQMEIAMQGVSRGDAQRAQRAGGGTGLTDAESLAIQTRGLHDSERGRPPMVNVDASSEMGGEDATAVNVPWTPEQWRAAGYTQMPDGSWDIVSPTPPAAVVEVPKVETNITPPSAADLSAAQANADALTVNPAGSQPGGTAVNATWEDVANQRAAEAAAAQAAATTTPASVTAGLPAATAVNMAAGQDPWGTMYQASLSPREMWEQYRMQQFGDAPLGAQLAAQRNMDIGYEPAMGRYMLGQAAGRIAPSATAFTPGERFGEYIRGGQRADLDELRRNYQMLGSALGAYGTGGTPAAGTAGYLDVFGDPSDPSRLRGNVLQATRAALGTNAFTGGGALGNIYDVMQRQYGAGGAGRFADWVGTAFQPQQQQPLFQQPANGRQPQLLGTETLQQQSPNWDMQLEDF